MLTPQMDRDMLCGLIEAAAKMIVAATVLLDSKASDRMPAYRDAARADLGLELGKLNATISQALSLDVADREFALQGMQRAQERFRLTI